MDEHLIPTIERKLGSDFERSLFHAALANFQNCKGPLRFNNFAYAFRELVRHVLRRLAPDERVLKCSWYRNETEQEDKVTRRQRVYYAVHGGLAPKFVSEELGLDVDEFFRRLRDILDRLSEHTHIEPHAFGISDNRAWLYMEETLESLSALFALIDGARNALVQALWGYIDQSTFETMIESTFDEVDILATHHNMEDV